MVTHSRSDLTGHKQVLETLCDAARSLSRRGWTPARSGNFSVRISAESIAISVSGCDKANLTVADLMLVDNFGAALDNSSTPSAECLLHAHLYRRYAHAGCVLHTHSRYQTVASLQHAERGGLTLRGYELLKAFDGFDSHLQTLRVPVVANAQHMPALVAMVDPLLDDHCCAYLIAGHGLYCWGTDVAVAMRHAEALDFILGCELTRHGLT